MIHRGIAVIIATILVIVLGACTITPDTYTLATVNGNRITLKDLEDNPQFAGFMEQLVMTQLIEDAAAAKGLSVNDEDLNEKLEEMKAGAGGQAMWEEQLAAQGMDEDDVRGLIRPQMLLTELLKASVEVTEEDARAEFEMNPDYYRRAYGKENNLTVDETENLTFEDMKDYLIDQKKLSKGYEQGQSTIDKLKAEAKIEYLYLSPEEREKMRQRQEKLKAEQTAKEPSVVETPIEEDASGEEAAKTEEGTTDEGAAEESATDAVPDEVDEAAEDESAAESEASGDNATPDEEAGEEKAGDK
ncbi:MAG: hypothetical protein A2Y63_06890 [Candidatus Riflebacteria bacterium RBG_13_59_9]|nr:MAG: hypothetical protein A2Y63_06890 [Candidatus Riflebacteria bacterium RBG_13_59_9]